MSTISSNIRGLIGLYLLLFALASHATLVSFDFDVNAVIPDSDSGGVADTHTLSGMSGLISAVTVNLQISGGFNGDLYGYLVSDNGFAVLLNRIGVTASNPYGESGSGMNVTLTSSGVGGIDVHDSSWLPGQVLTGVFQADGRDVNPIVALDTDARTALLDNFTGTNPNGNWTLFLADLSPIGEASIDRWGVSFELVPVPEPVNSALIGFTLFLTAQRLFRRKSQARGN